MDRVWQKKSINFILVHETVSHLGQLTSIGPAFSMLSVRCDTTSFISGRGKMAYWDTWKLIPEKTAIFVN